LTFHYQYQTAVQESLATVPIFSLTHKEETVEQSDDVQRARRQPENYMVYICNKLKILNMLC